MVYTAPRSEKKASERLEKNGIESFLPLKQTLRQWSDRKKKVKVPLFTSYLFVRVNLVHEKYKVLETFGVVQYVYHEGQPAVVRDQDIEDIKMLLENYTELEAVTLEPGQRVEIKSGTLGGKSGIIRDTKNGVLTLELENIGYQLIAKIPLKQVKKPRR